MTMHAIVIIFWPCTYLLAMNDFDCSEFIVYFHSIESKKANILYEDFAHSLNQKKESKLLQIRGDEQI